ncbi:MAG: SIS domain-containing protein [Patescibacteria group bacterium]
MIHYFFDSLTLHLQLVKDRHFQEQLGLVVEQVFQCLARGNKLLIAGNGGSAADAQHFAAELMGRYMKERQALPAISLTTDTSALTAIGNDYSFDQIFARQVSGLGVAGDMLMVFSTSGNSKNLLEAVSVARRKQLSTVGLLGNQGGLLKDAVALPLVVHSPSTPRIQEVHQLLLHIIAEEVERRLISS